MVSFLTPPVRNFDFAGTIIDSRPFGEGLINDTYLITTEEQTQAGPAHRHRYVLQRINRQVFQHPIWIVENIQYISGHLEHRNLPTPTPEHRPFTLPALVSSRDGLPYVKDRHDEIWRASVFVENTVTFNTMDQKSLAWETGYALGRFQRLVSTLDPDQLHDTLPGFHVTPDYLAHFDDVRQAMTGNLSSACEQCLAFIDSRRAMVPVLEQAHRQGRLQSRIIHGDPKLNNFLFDRRRLTAVSLIDLDTVKPGLIHYDIGDCLRSCCNPAGENPEEGTPVVFDLDIAKNWIRGYMGEAAGFLTDADRELLFDAVRLLPLELGLRFLTDYLTGNRYFKIRYPEHNLHRAITQFKLVESIEEQESAIRRCFQA